MNGILLLDKEQTWTSNDAVVKLKGILHQRRVGHAGTLDPMATGLLVVFAGRATRAVSFAEAARKRYRAALRLGTVTDTQDIWGTVLEQRETDVTREELENVLSRFIGEQLQTPPMYSAIRVDGKRLYDIARKGGEVERKARPITVHELKLLGREGEDWILDICCSKGTYVRTLCHDTGAALGCGGGGEAHPLRGRVSHRSVRRRVPGLRGERCIPHAGPLGKRQHVDREKLF